MDWMQIAIIILATTTVWFWCDAMEMRLRIKMLSTPTDPTQIDLELATTNQLLAELRRRPIWFVMIREKQPDDNVPTSMSRCLDVLNVPISEVPNILAVTREFVLNALGENP